MSDIYNIIYIDALIDYLQSHILWCMAHSTFHLQSVWHNGQYHTCNYRYVAIMKRFLLIVH